MIGKMSSKKARCRQGVLRVQQAVRLTEMAHFGMAELLSCRRASSVQYDPWLIVERWRALDGSWHGNISSLLFFVALLLGGPSTAGAWPGECRAAGQFNVRLF